MRTASSLGLSHEIPSAQSIPPISAADGCRWSRQLGGGAVARVMRMSVSGEADAIKMDVSLG